jgi:uncharacterized protein
MINILDVISSELGIKLWQTENVIELKNDGATMPFIARYRKERTGELDENFIRNIFDRFEYLTELEDRKATILKSIEEQGKLTDELKNKIEKCISKTELEDLYLPYKPKKRTRATIAKEKGLEPLAITIKEFNKPNMPDFSLEDEAAKYISEEKGVKDANEAIKGASDIIAEEISEVADYRAWIREFLINDGYFNTKIKDDVPVGSTKFEMYRSFSVPVKSISAHNMLAIRRGETEEIVHLDLKFDEEKVLNYLSKKIIFSSKTNLKTLFESIIKDAFARLMKVSLISEARLNKKGLADEESIRVFESNLRQLLLSSPAGMKMTIGIDPGFRTGCKVSVVNTVGDFVEYYTIFPFNAEYQKVEAKKILISLIKKFNVQLIAIGNGTASRETDEFVTSVLTDLELKPIKVIVSEAGASVYSASVVANEEFPEMDLTVRGAISIARRLQDPLAELVKIDPKSIGVGQYQHDVDQKLLKKKLEETVISCVNYVGVDLNTASKELLTYVSGINSTIAKNIVDFRAKNGAFNKREELLKVPRFGPKAYEQAAGFLKIRNGVRLLDNTAVHPESYHIVEAISNDLNTDLTSLINNSDLLKSINLNKYVNDSIGLPTLKDIIKELEKPGRDPRAEFKYASFDDTIKEIKQLKSGMVLEGVVTNITNFGAFVDIGVHQDGLVHISEMTNQFIKDPTQIVKVGQVVKVRVLEVNESLKRISLSMKMNDAVKKAPPKKESIFFSLDDLQNRFKK